jgi:hypothetical protein
MMDEIKMAQVEIVKIKMLFNKGKLTYDEAKEKAEPYIKVINDKMYEVAKSFGKKHYKVTFVGLMR